MLKTDMAPMIPKHVFMPKIAKFTRCGTDTGNQYFKAIILKVLQNRKCICNPIQCFMFLCKICHPTILITNLQFSITPMSDLDMLLYYRSVARD